MNDQDIDRHAEKARNAYFGVSRRGPIEFSSIHPQSQQIWREVVKAVLSEATPAPAQPDPLHVANERGEGKASKWVRTEECLPPMWTTVLVHPRPTDYCCEAEVDGEGVWFYGEYEANLGHHLRVCKPTHWMPAPAAPKEKP